MTTLVIVSLALSLTQLITIGWLSRTVTRVRRDNADTSYRVQGIHHALECHERRIDLLVGNHNHHRERLDSTWFKLQTLDNAMRDQLLSIEAIETLVEHIANDMEEIDSELEATISEVVTQETAVERQFRGVNGEIDNLYDDVRIGGGM